MFARRFREYRGFSRGIFPAGRSQARQHRSSVAGNCFAHRRSRDWSRTAHQSARIVVGARAKRDARLFAPPGENGGSFTGRLVQHRRHSNDRRRWFCSHHGSLEPLQQNRRRDGAAHKNRRQAAGNRRGGGTSICGDGDSRPTKRGTTNCAAHANRRGTRRMPGPIRRGGLAGTVEAAAGPISAHQALPYLGTGAGFTAREGDWQWLA